MYSGVFVGNKYINSIPTIKTLGNKYSYSNNQKIKYSHFQLVLKGKKKKDNKQEGSVNENQPSTPVVFSCTDLSHMFLFHSVTG